MNHRLFLIVLSLFCLGLTIFAVTTHKHATAQHLTDVASIQNYSNKVVLVSDELERQKQVNTIFEKDLQTQKQAFAYLTNNYNSLSSALSHAEATLTNMQQEVAKRDAEISELEARNDELSDQALELSTSITNLTLQIAETQRKLAASEGDKAFLEKELGRLMSEKANLERQFSDLAVLRARVARLKQDLNIARRIEWSRHGLSASVDQKGAQRLLKGLQVAQTQPGYDLNVEVDAAGSYKVVPQTTSTNSPPVP